MELLNFSLGSVQKFTLSGAGATWEYCTLVCSEIKEWIGFLKCSCLKVFAQSYWHVIFLSNTIWDRRKTSFPFLQYFCQLFCTNYVCVDINYYKVPWNWTLLCNCTLFVQWIPTISSFENECLASTCLILPLLSELQEGCASWAKGGFLCFPSSEIPCHWASSLHIGVLIWHEGFALVEPWLLHLKAFDCLKCQPVLKSISCAPQKI